MWKYFIYLFKFYFKFKNNSQGVQLLHPIKHTDGVLYCPGDFVIANISVKIKSNNN